MKNGKLTTEISVRNERILIDEFISKVCMCLSVCVCVLSIFNDRREIQSETEDFLNTNMNAKNNYFEYRNNNFNIQQT